MQQSDAQTPLLIQYTGRGHRGQPLPSLPPSLHPSTIYLPRDPLVQCLPFFFRQLTRYRLALPPPLLRALRKYAAAAPETATG